MAITLLFGAANAINYIAGSATLDEVVAATEAESKNAVDSLIKQKNFGSVQYGGFLGGYYGGFNINLDLSFRVCEIDKHFSEPGFFSPGLDKALGCKSSKTYTVFTDRGGLAGGQNIGMQYFKALLGL